LRFARCGGMWGPGFVRFGDPVPRDALEAARAAASRANVVLSIGTSAVVQPAASRARATEILPPLVEAVKRRIAA